ncbi:NFACT family protein [Candidatus Woesearchaeota archaeon]|nr:NFACT family protein [Candidatus Woesearchaeota archaeon]
MKSHLTAIELRHCIAELQELCHGRMDKIYQPTPEELLFQIHLPNKGRVLLKFIKGKFLYRTMHKQEIPLQPSSFCMYLRKRLGNARITAIQQVNFERVVLIVLETKEQQYHFYAELFGKGNFLL